MKNSLLVQKAKLLLEARNASTAINDRALATGPCRVRLWINIEVHGVASLTIRRAGHEFSAVGHHNGDGVIIGVDI